MDRLLLSIRKSPQGEPQEILEPVQVKRLSQQLNDRALHVQALGFFRSCPRGSASRGNLGGQLCLRYLIASHQRLASMLILQRRDYGFPGGAFWFQIS
jgi:hypothetical protein